MGTRGAYGFYKKGVNKITYNHYDNYPDALGKDIFEFIKNHTDEELNKTFTNIEMVNGDLLPNPRHIEMAKKAGIIDLTVSERSENDWYCLLRGAQGDLNIYLNNEMPMIDNAIFMADSLFCEYAYIINLNNRRLEIYKGFNQMRQPIKKNRYMKLPTESYPSWAKYEPVALVGTMSFDTIRKMKADAFIKKANHMCGNDEEE